MRPLIALVLFAVTGCRFQGELAGGSQTRCQSNSDCPSAARCIAFGICAQLDTVTLSKRIEPAVAGSGQTVRVTLDFEASRATPPQVWAITALTKDEAVLTSHTDTSFNYEWVVPRVSGIDQALFIADGAAFNQRVIELGAIAIDSKAPTLQLVTLQLTPPSAELLGTGLRDIRKVTNSSEVELLLQSDEPLSAPPTVWFEQGSNRIPLSLLRTIQTSEWRLKGNVGQVQGLTTLRVKASAQDTQGNVSEDTIAELDVDTELPPAPAVDRRNAIVFRRAPKGSLDVPKVPDFRLSATAGSIEPNSLVIVSSGGGIFGRVTSDADGGISTVRLALRDDLDSVSLRVADEAGNLSAETRVRDIELNIYEEAKNFAFRQSIGPTTPLTLSPSLPTGPMAALPPVARAAPSVVVLRELVEQWPSRPESAQSSYVFFEERCDPLFNQKVPVIFWYETGIDFGLSACSTSPGAHWGRTLPALLVLDFIGSRRVDLDPDLTFVAGAFGAGLEGFFSSGEAASYRPLNTTIGRRYPAAALDMLRDEVILFGGESMDGGVLGDTWKMPYRGELTALTPAGRTPPARKHAAMAYHPGLGKVILHGGNNGIRTLSDTWLWDGQQWEEVVHQRPLAREQHEMIYSFGRASTLISGGLRDGARSPQMAAFVNNEWASPKVQPNLNIPATCPHQGVARAYITPNGVEAICPLPGDAGFAFYPPDGGIGQRIPFVPYTGPGPNYSYNMRTERTNLFGPTTVSSDFSTSQLAVLNRGVWVTAGNINGRQFKGTCFIWQGEFACNDGNAVMLSNNAVINLPATALPVIAAHVWPQSTGVWVADRTTNDSKTTRYEVRSNGTFRELMGSFFQVASVAFAGAPTGELFVILRRPDGTDTTDIEVFNGTEWIRSGVSARSNYFAMTQPVEALPGRFFTFNFGHLFGSGDPISNVSPARYELISKGIRPTLQVSLPFPPNGCDTLSQVEVEAEGSGSAGGVQGFGVHLWDGYWFNPTPAVTAEPGITRAKATHRNPGAAYRFGFSVGPPNDSTQQAGAVRFSTEGASRGALDGELQLTAFQTRYTCRLSAMQ